MKPNMVGFSFANNNRPGLYFFTISLGFFFHFSLKKFAMKNFLVGIKFVRFAKVRWTFRELVSVDGAFWLWQFRWCRWCDDGHWLLILDRQSSKAVQGRSAHPSMNGNTGQHLAAGWLLQRPDRRDDDDSTATDSQPLSVFRGIRRRHNMCWMFDSMHQVFHLIITTYRVLGRGRRVWMMSR